MRQVCIIVVKQPLRTIVIWLSIFALLTATETAKAGPFQNFFRALSRSIPHPGPKQRSHRSSRTQNNETVTRDASNDQTSGNAAVVPPNGRSVNEAAPSGASNNQTSSSAVATPPNGHNVRAAKSASAAKNGKSGLLYGTPVPGKEGLVISPFSPDSGYIDVRSFPPGTEVKDPYTGKIFLTP